MYKTRIVPAKKLTAPFRFKIAGSMYSIDDVHPNAFDERIIHATNIEDGSQVTLIVGKNAQFKIYILTK